MGIFARRAARQRLRRATEESLTIPTFSSPIDCSPWVIGALWPSELSPGNAETATLAQHLKADMQRIADTANDELRAIGRAAMTYAVRRDAEARVIGEARDLAVRRVESTLHQLRQLQRPAVSSSDSEKTQVLPAVRDDPPAGDLPRPPAADDRLQRLLAYAARQEPRLNWAVGERSDGTTVLVTDLAHGWIPPGIAVPHGVRLLAPQRRTGRIAHLMGTTTRVVTYVPGDSARWSTDFGDLQPSVQPLESPMVEDLDRQLAVATHRRAGLPRLVSMLVQAAATGADIGEQEIDLLRVHLDTIRYQVLAQYPATDPAPLLTCMLLAAIEGRVAGDPVSANYHFAWFAELDAAPAGQRGETTPKSTA